MKLGSIRYLTAEGFKNTWVNRLMTFASIGVLMACMILIGLALIFSENISLAMGKLERENVVMVYMKDYSWALYGEKASDNVSSEDTSSTENTDTQSENENVEENSTEAPDVNGIRPSDYVIHNDEEAKALCQKILSLPNVASAEYISSSQGLEEVTSTMLGGYKEHFSFLNDEYGNPLSAAARVTMKKMDKFDETVAQIQKLSGVDVIRSHSGLANKLDSLKNGIAVAGFWIIVILLVISLMIVSNTIRVTMYNRKLQISIMKAVGATNSFIRIPFIVEGILIGSISAILSEGVLYFIYRVATESIESLRGSPVIPFSNMMWQLLGIFMIIGIGAGALGSFFIIRKYLRKEGSEFAAI